MKIIKTLPEYFKAKVTSEQYKLMAIHIKESVPFANIGKPDTELIFAIRMGTQFFDVVKPWYKTCDFTKLELSEYIGDEITPTDLCAVTPTSKKEYDVVYHTLSSSFYAKNPCGLFQKIIDEGTAVSKITSYLDSYTETLLKFVI